VTLVARFEIHHIQFLDPQGRPTQPLPEFARDPKNLVRLYRSIVLARSFDAKAVALQRTGQLGTFASSLGQEAIGVAVASVMKPEDVLVPTYRDTGAMLMRGVKMEEILLYWSGDEQGSNFSGPRRDFPICVPIATQACHAAGVAFAMKHRREPRVAVCLAGDGATSKGDFYESLNVAGAWKLPVVFVVENNGWAISVPRSAQTATETLAQKAIAAGIPGEQADGNDVIAMRHCVGNLVEKARNGGGASLIEALSYRLHDHTTADDATRYRDADEVNRQWNLEPAARLRAYLLSQGAWSKEQEESLLKECSERVQAAVEAYQAAPLPPPEQMFDYLYAALPAAFKSQRAAAIAEGKRHG
jgi:2-oxoisovalerate dehydrogenase E1 component alpha subunit